MLWKAEYELWKENRKFTAYDKKNFKSNYQSSYIFIYVTQRENHSLYVFVKV